MSSGNNSKYQLLSTDEIKPPVLTGPGQEIQFDTSVKLQNKQVTGEPYILVRNDRLSIWPVVRVGKSSETSEVIQFMEKFNSHYRILDKLKLDRVRAA